MAIYIICKEYSIKSQNNRQESRWSSTERFCPVWGCLLRCSSPCTAGGSALAVTNTAAVHVHSISKWKLQRGFTAHVPRMRLIEVRVIVRLHLYFDLGHRTRHPSAQGHSRRWRAWDLQVEGDAEGWRGWGVGAWGPRTNTNHLMRQRFMRKMNCCCVDCARRTAN